MKKISLLKGLICYIFILSLSMLTVNAQEINEDTPESARDFINENSEWGKVKTNGSITIDDHDISLLVTFVSPEEALTKFKQTYKEQLLDIQRDTELQELTEENYKDYYDLLIAKGDDYFGKDEINKVYGFFDIYENNNHNQIIKEKAMQLNFRSNLYDRNELLEIIDALSPLYNERVNNSFNSRIVTHLSQINVTAATTYAKKYATTPNPSYTYYSADCTNFASQIAYAGGLRQGTSWKPYTGGWTVANSFVALWGKKGKSTKWSSFVTTLKPGNFIGADFGGDGGIDHIAYITANGTTSATKYIAQHTSNYHSLSSSTGWVNDSGGRILWIIGNP